LPNHLVTALSQRSQHSGLDPVLDHEYAGLHLARMERPGEARRGPAIVVKGSTGKLIKGDRNR